MSLKVIGAGLGRTGTLSLKMALEQLGFEKCYHMEEFIRNPSTVGEWEKAQRNKPANWDLVFEGYESAVDFPVCSYYKELMEKYPEAKVILTVRDPEKWYDSASSTILKFNPPLGMVLGWVFTYPFLKKTRDHMRMGLHNQKMLKNAFRNAKDRGSTIEDFNRHNEEVKAYVPEERLLVYEVKQGWEPLCNFLGVDIPDSPFPRSNIREDFREWLISLFKQ